MSGSRCRFIASFPPPLYIDWCHQSGGCVNDASVLQYDSGGDVTDVDDDDEDEMSGIRHT